LDIDLFKHFLEFKDAEQQNYQKEDAIHKLIRPMRVDSSDWRLKLTTSGFSMIVSPSSSSLRQTATPTSTQT
jgi:hypothetical protein